MDVSFRVIEFMGGSVVERGFAIGLEHQILG